jgi:hypothetical protein
MPKKTKFTRLDSLISNAVFRVAVLISLLPGVFMFPAAPSAPAPDKQIPIKIDSTPINHFDLRDSSRRRFGALEFRGGLVLASSDSNFGGISALHMQRDALHFIALSDRAFWLSGELVYRGNRPAQIVNSILAPILNSSGKAAHWDTEAIANDGSTLYVGMERKGAISRFNFGQKGFLAPAEPVAVPASVNDLPGNKGLEAIVFAPKGFPLGGTLIALSERALDESGNLKAFLIGGPNPGSFSVKRTENYDISDAALLPDGDLLILERKFSLLDRFFMRIRRIRLNRIRPGAVVDGPAIIQADKNNQIDNMEALSVHKTGSGEIVLTLMSDDNFSPLQRTLLLQFTLIEM